MPIYEAPVGNVLFLLNDVLGFTRYANLPGFADATPDVVDGDPRAKARASPRRCCSRSTASATSRAAPATTTAA